MKTIFFVTTMLAASLTATAQFTQPGQRVIGGTISFNSGNNLGNNQPGFDSKGNNFSVGINAGKFKKKNVLTSVAVSYSHSLSKNISPINTTKNTYNAGYISFGKTYFKEIAKKLFVGLGGAVNLGYNEVVTENSPQINETNSRGYSVGIGIEPTLSYQLTERFLVNLGPSTDFLNLNYSNSKITYTQFGQPNSTGSSQSVNLNTGFFDSPLSNVSIGFNYLLKNK